MRKKAWLYHPAIGYYRPSGVDKVTGVPTIDTITKNLKEKGVI